MPTFTQDHVRRGRTLSAADTKSSFTFGDLILEFAPDGSVVDRAIMQRFADEVSKSCSFCLEARRGAIAYPKPTKANPKGRRNDLSWAVHMEFISQPDRIKLLHQRQQWTVRSARDFLGKAPMDKVHQPADPSSRPSVAAVRSALQDKATADEVFQDVSTRHAARESVNRTRAADHQQFEQRQELAQPNLPMERGVAEVIGGLRRASVAISDAVNSVQKLSTMPDFDLTDKARVDLEMWRRFIAEGLVLIDDWLERGFLADQAADYLRSLGGDAR